MIINCPHCLQEITVEDSASGRYECPLCQGAIEFSQPSQTPPPEVILSASKAPSGMPDVLCEKCHSLMLPQKILRFGSGVYVLGRFILWPGVLMIGVGLFSIASCIQANSINQDLVNRAQGAEKLALMQRTGEVLVQDFVISTGLLFFGAVAILLARILGGKMRVMKCTTCGFFYKTV